MPGDIALARRHVRKTQQFKLGWANCTKWSKWSSEMLFPPKLKTDHKSQIKVRNYIYLRSAITTLAWVNLFVFPYFLHKVRSYLLLTIFNRLCHRWARHCPSHANGVASVTVKVLHTLMLLVLAEVSVSLCNHFYFGLQVEGLDHRVHQLAHEVETICFYEHMCISVFVSFCSLYSCLRT